MEGLQKQIQEQYTEALAGARGEEGGKAPEGWNPIIQGNYSKDFAEEVPKEALEASFGCGNPIALAKIAKGDVVLDLGSGAGTDVFLSAKRVGPTGKVYGLDMTDAMLSAARDSAAKANITNVEFIKGTIEEIPLPDNSVNVIISNCVVNLSTDKDKVFREAYRVLKPGGHFAISDILLTHHLPPKFVQNLALYAGCISGALEEQECLTKMKNAGFLDASSERVKIYDKEDIMQMAKGFHCVTGTSCCGSSSSSPPELGPDDLQEITGVLGGVVMSSFIRGSKASS